MVGNDTMREGGREVMCIFSARVGTCIFTFAFNQHTFELMIW
jgi:hypothetical protein